jgi:hypothetical protein
MKVGVLITNCVDGPDVKETREHRLSS